MRLAFAAAVVPWMMNLKAERVAVLQVVLVSGTATSFSRLLICSFVQLSLL
jgi:hypothetical protein